MVADYRTRLIGLLIAPFHERRFFAFCTMVKLGILVFYGERFSGQCPLDPVLVAI